MSYQPYSEGTHFGGPARLYRFEGTAYGASVVRHWGSYGGPEGLWELAVLSFKDDKWEICYCTSVSSDVIGWLSDDDVQEALAKIDALNDHQCICRSEWGRWAGRGERR